jgi:general secretion pathway protein G
MVRNRALASRPRKARRGFTLLEILLVVAILVTLMAIVAPNVLGSREKANLGIAKIDVKQLENGVNLYNANYGRVPESSEGLAALATRPADAPQNLTPVLKPDDVNKLDPWGNPYQYAKEGGRSSVGFDVWSNGPDRQSGTADDIGNWTSASGAGS